MGAEGEVARSRNGLALLLKRMPFHHLLRGCTRTHVEAAVQAANMPPQFRVKVRGDVLILRKYGGPAPLNTGWAVKARMEETADGVLLTGHQCYLSDRLYFAAFTAFSAFLLSIVASLVITKGPDAELIPRLVLALVPGLLALLILVLQPSAVSRQEERAVQLLNGLLERR